MGGHRGADCRGVRTRPVVTAWDRRQDVARTLIDEADLDVVALAAEHWTVAADAFLRYGKGRHPAALTFGDCLTYAVSKVADEPLLCVGNDFPATDLRLVG